MIRRLLFATVILSAAAASAPQAGASPTIGVRCGANEDRVWVYETLVDFNVETKLKCGDPVEILDRVKGYVKIRTASGDEGYVAATAFPKSAIPPEPEDHSHDLQAVSQQMLANQRNNPAPTVEKSSFASTPSTSASTISAAPAPVVVAATKPTPATAPQPVAQPAPTPTAAAVTPAPQPAPQPAPVAQPTPVASPAPAAVAVTTPAPTPAPAPQPAAKPVVVAAATPAPQPTPQPVPASRPAPPTIAPKPAAAPAPVAQPAPAVVAKSTPAPAPAAREMEVTLTTATPAPQPQPAPTPQPQPQPVAAPAPTTTVAYAAPAPAPKSAPAAQPVAAKPPVDPDTEEETYAPAAESTANCNSFFVAYGLSPNQYKWIQQNRKKAFPTVCPAPTQSMVDYIVIFTHDVDFYSVTMPTQVHHEANGFSDWAPLETVDSAIMSPSDANKSHHEYVFVFHARRGTYDPSAFSARRKPLFSKDETNMLGSHGGFRTVMDALTWIETTGASRESAQR
jgi:Bacterial SH3 domain